MLYLKGYGEHAITNLFLGDCFDFACVIFTNDFLRHMNYEYFCVTYLFATSFFFLNAVRPLPSTIIHINIHIHIHIHT